MTLGGLRVNGEATSVPLSKPVPRLPIQTASIIINILGQVQLDPPPPSTPSPYVNSYCVITREGWIHELC